MEQMNNTSYSVLMSVYIKENPTYLKQAIDSILNQTIKTDDFVIVLDGPLTDELNDVINEARAQNSDIITIVPLSTNMGLGKALSEGLMHCKHELIARQDSDDISLPDRISKQLELITNTGADLISGTIEEFIDSTDNIVGKRLLPTTNEEIIKFSHKRNPFNHPAVMFKKTACLKAGNYNEDYHLFEDYNLWVRMLMEGAIGANLCDTIVYMRTTNDTYIRRGGVSYAKDMLRFHKWLYKSSWSTYKDYITGAIPHALVCVLPAFIRRGVYKIIH